MKRKSFRVIEDSDRETVKGMISKTLQQLGPGFGMPVNNRNENLNIKGHSSDQYQ